MVRSAARFRRALTRKLYCCGNTRRQLLEQFDLSLNTFLEDHPTATEAELSAAFGTPEEMARVMMEGVGDQEKGRYDRKRKFIQAVAASLFVACMAFAIYAFFVKDIPVESTDIVFEGTIPQTEEVPE